MMIGKAKFKSEIEVSNFILYINENYLQLKEKASKIKHNFYGKDVFDKTNHDIYESVLNSHFGTFFSHPHYLDNLNKEFKQIHTYVSSMDTWYDLIYEIEDIAIIRYGKISFLIFDKDKYLNIEYLQDYSNIPIGEIKRFTLLEDKENPIAVLVPEDNISINDINKKTFQFDSEINNINKQMEDIQYSRTSELKAFEDKIQQLKQEMNAKRDSMLEVMNKKKAEFELMKAELEKQLRILEDSIYSIRCYLGETIEIFKLRTGKVAPINTPLIINQKMKYLDEDLAQLFSLYLDDLDSGKYKIFEELIKYNDQALEYFAPYDRCMSFFKISKDSKGFYVNNKNDMLDHYDVLHGNRVGFILRNLDEVFIGYTEEENINLSEDIFLKPELKQIDEDVIAMNSSHIEMESRIFIFSILQGILERKEILQLPEKVNIFTSFNRNPYIVWSFADNQISDKRFGNFSDLIGKLNLINLVGDKILVIRSSIEESSYERGKSYRGKGEGEINRTHDCIVVDGINEINSMEKNGNIYVSAKKSYSSLGATSNFLINKSEYINMTYMNSLWFKYFIVNKQIGNYSLGGSKINFAYIVKYLKQGLDWLVKREINEKALIEEFYNNLDNVSEWQVLLSNWKLLNEVRFVTPYQAKRFAKLLHSGKINIKRHLYNGIFYQKDTSSELNNLGSVYLKGSRRSYRYESDIILQDDVTDEIIVVEEEKALLRIQKAYSIVMNNLNKYKISNDDVKKHISDNNEEGKEILHLLNSDFTYKEYNANDFKNDYKDKINDTEYARFSKLFWSNEVIRNYRCLFGYLEDIQAIRFEKEYDEIELKFI